MKKMLTFILCVSMMLGLSACGGSGGNQAQEPAQGGSDNTSGSSAPAGGTVELTLDSGLTPTHMINTCGQELVDLVAEKSNGEIKINFYPADTLGNSTERVGMLLAGETDISMQALSALDSYNPRQGVISAFFMFEDWDHYQKFQKSDLYAEILGGLEEETNTTVLGEIYYAKRNILSKKPIQSLEDLKGVKFRAPNEDMPIASIRALGASPTPMPGNEVYVALQNGTIDTTETSAEQMVTESYYEVADNITFTGHQIQTQLFLMSNAGRAKLTDDQFALLCEAVDEVTEKYNVLMQEAEAEKEDFLRETINHFDDVDMAPFRAALETMYEEYDDVWGDGTWEAIRALA